MSAALEQARDAWLRQIDEDPILIVIFRKPKVDNGFGGLVEDPFGTARAETARIRICQERKQDEVVSPVGLTEDPQRYIICDYRTTVYKDEIFEALGKRWRIGVIDEKHRWGGTIGYRAPIRLASEVDA